MKFWIVETSDGSIHIIGSSETPKRADYVKVIPAPAGVEVGDEKALVRVGDTFSLDQQVKDKKAADRAKAVQDKAQKLLDKSQALSRLKSADLSGLDSKVKSVLEDIIKVLGG